MLAWVLVAPSAVGAARGRVDNRQGVACFRVPQGVCRRETAARDRREEATTLLADAPGEMRSLEGVVPAAGRVRSEIEEAC
eukprot:9136166-Pyramimonas_sp.AAC.1